jgi:hypothetical protein
MIHSASILQDDTVEGIFSAQGYFLGIAQRILASGRSTRVVLPGRGEVLLFPRRNEYCANVADMADFCLAPAAQFEVTVLDEAAEMAQLDPGRHIGDLMWQAAFHASRGNMIEDCSKLDVVEFRRWPNLTRLPKTPNTMRICALLTRHPMTIMLVRRKLGIERRELYQIYSAAYCAGLVNIISRTSPAAANDAVVDAPAEAPVQERSMLRSLFAKIMRL